MSSPDHLKYQDINKFIKARLLLRTRDFSIQLHGVHKHLFECVRDRVLKVIRDWALTFRVDKVVKGGLADVHEPGQINSLRLAHGVDGLKLKFRFFIFRDSSFDDCSVVRRCLHCRVIRLIYSRTAKALMLGDLREDVEGVETGNRSKLKISKL